jgi:hypothetical protein
MYNVLMLLLLLLLLLLLVVVVVVVVVPVELRNLRRLSLVKKLIKEWLLLSDD